MCHLAMADPWEASTCFQAVQAISPEFASAHIYEGCARALMGDHARAWDEFGWIYKGHRRTAATEQPLWDGSELRGRRILLWTQEGRGDVIQFLRYVPLVARMNGHVIVECHHAQLLPLIARMDGVSRVIASRDVPVPFDTHAPLVYLPALLPQYREAYPELVPYLSVPSALESSWGDVLDTGPGLRVGISWMGNKEHPHADSRFMPLEQFAPLLSLPGVRLVSLQHGPEAGALEAAPWNVRVERLNDGRTSIMDVGAAMKHLNVVISVDTMVAHLAGALGLQVWLLLRRESNWRWGLTGATTEWYPTMRIFRQRAQGEWTEVIEDVCAEVRKMSTAGSDGGGRDGAAVLTQRGGEARDE